MTADQLVGTLLITGLFGVFGMWIFGIGLLINDPMNHWDRRDRKKRKRMYLSGAGVRLL